MNKIVSALLLTVALAVPVALTARDQDHQKAAIQVKVYQDQRHHDTHEWNDNENQRYQTYLTEHHKKNRDFDKISRKDQNSYWDWRHQH
jgi:Ni/Co efflux regulator RcnB